MEIARLQALITADDRQFRQKMAEADRTGRSTAKSLSSSFSNLKLAIPGLGGLSKLAGETKQAFAGAFAGLGTELLTGAIGQVTSGFTLAIKTGLDFNKMMEGAGVVFENFAGSAAGAQKHLDDLKNFAKSSPFDLPDLIQASARMQAFGTNINQVIPDLKNLQNAAALAAGTSGNFTEALTGITTALGQMKAKGTVSAEEMQQLAERGIPAWDLLAAKIGKSVEQTRKLAEQGKLRGAPAVDALLEAFGESKFAGLGEKLARTTLGKESNLRDALTQQAGEAAKDTVLAYNSALDAALKTAQTPQALNVGKSANAPVAAGLQIGADIMSGETTAKDIGKALLPTAKDTVKELGSILSKGISDAWSVAKDVASGVAEAAGVSMGDAAATGTKKSLKIQSPSEVYFEFGLMAAEGFQLGFDAGKKRLRVDLTDLAKQFGDQASEIAKTMESVLGKVGAEKLLKKGIAFGPGFFTSGQADVDAQIKKQAQRQSLPPELLFAQLLRESRFNPTATSPAGAGGIAQFMPATAERFGLKDVTDAMDSIRAQADYMRKLFDKFGKFGNVESLALAGYNAGENRKTLKAGNVPNISETKDYIAEISAVAEAIRSSAPSYQQITSAAPQVKETILRLADLAAPMVALAQSPITKQRPGEGAQAKPLPGTIIQGGGDSIDIRGSKFDPVPYQQMTLAMNSLSDKTRLARAAMEPLPPVLENAAAKTRDWASEIIQVPNKFGSSEERFTQFKERLGQGFDDAIGALVTGSGRWQDVAKNVAVDFFNGLASEMMMAATGGKYGSLGGLLGGLVGGLFGGMFGFGGKKAGGGAVAMGSGYLVGEQGPELFMPGMSGTIIPSGQTRSMMASAGGKVVNITINVPISAPAGSITPQTRQQIATQTAQAMQAALARNS